MEKTPSTSPIVSVEWLAENLSKPNLVVLNADLAPIGKPQSEKETMKIKRAIFFDLDNTFSDTNSTLPHTLPTAEAFTNEVQKLGINQDSTIVVYDNTGVYSSPRAWWMFRAMGHQKVFVLNGGFPAWLQSGFECEPITQQTEKTRGNFVANYQADLISNSERVLEAIQNNKKAIIDARSSERFLGKVAEPREGLRRGHIPNSVNLPFAKVLNGNMMRPSNELKEIFANLITNEDRQLIFSCGSGVTACIIALGAEIAGYSKLSVYDGSWSEWGIPSDLPCQV